MPAKKIVKKPAKKVATKKATAKIEKKVVVKKAAKPVVKKTVTKTVTKTLKPKINFWTNLIQEKNGIGVLNILAVLACLLIIGFTALLIDNKTNKKFVPVDASNIGTAQTIKLDCNAGQTALAALKESNQVNTQDSSVGVFVNSINGVENTNDSFWIFYANDQISGVSPDMYNCQNSDKLEWRLEKIL